MTSVRDSFVARFGESDAAAVEAAGLGHMDDGMHGADNHGSDPFKYAFLAAIGWECVGRFSVEHGIKASTEDMKVWALAEGDLGSHDGDVPDYLALMCGAYDEWLHKSEVSS